MPILTPEERVGSTMAGKYRLESILATGGMATVFAGVHAWTEREVAVKILNYEHARDPEIVRRFLQEARSAAQLKHANVVDVLDMGEDTDGTVYLVLERLHGETLKARMKRGTLSLREVSALVLPVMRAVASAHAKNVVHRDIKPDNIYLATHEGSAVVPKLLDFGIAKVVASDSGSTRTGMMVGTPSYMAPEQVRGERDVGPPADVWSMGVVLHAALTGRVPFEGETSAAVLARVITERAQPIATHAPTLRSSVAAVIDRALVFEQQQRFADMGQMVSALEAAIDGPSEPQRALERVATPISRGPLQPPMTPAVRLPSAPGGPFVSESPTMQLGDRDLDQVTQPGPPTAASAAMLPAATPFAWAPAPSAEPAPPPSRLPWVVAAIGAIAVATVGVGYAMLGAGETTPTPVAIPITTVAAPPPSAIAPGPSVIAPTEPQPAVVVTATPEPVPATVVTPEPAIADVDAGAPARVATTRAEPRSPSTSSSTSTSTSISTSPSISPSISTSTSTSTSTHPPTTRSGRTPQRGTGGALILH
jgi:serine/threonine protein kinase